MRSSLTTKYVLLIIITVIISLLSCSPDYLKKYSKLENSDIKEPVVFDHDFKKAVYKTSFTVMGKQMTGILLIKILEDQEYRFVFVSEIGLKYFDLGISNSNDSLVFKSHYLMPALDRENIKDILFQDFSVLITNKLSNIKPVFYKETKSGNLAFTYYETNTKQVYFLNNEQDKIKQIVWKNKQCGKSEILLSNSQTSLIQTIKISNEKYRILIEINMID